MNLSIFDPTNESGHKKMSIELKAGEALVLYKEITLSLQKMAIPNTILMEFVGILANIINTDCDDNCLTEL